MNPFVNSPINLGPIPAPPQKRTFLDKVDSVFKKVTPIVEQGIDVYGRVKTVSPQKRRNIVAPVAPDITQTKIETRQGMSTAAKVGISLGVAALIGTVVYFATKKK